MQNELLSCAIRAALLAGKDILNIYDDPKADFAIERKADNSPLTIADKRSHARIMDELDATSIPVLSEEGRLTDYDKRKGWKTLWVVDPFRRPFSRRFDGTGRPVAFGTGRHERLCGRSLPFPSFP